ncbi:hypothetical protein FQR65_LT15723 [Abscondita terminalis]|nr:hypothetical protein FQR65_LT15723 [Abscondita terminalis]
MPRMLDNDFKSHFRMSRGTFEYILQIISVKLMRSYPGLGMIRPEKQFLLCIWRMATPDSYRSICEKFKVSRSTALLAVRRVTIRRPARNRAENNWREFQAVSAFPKVLGAIDGTHIQIPAPRKNPEAYINRKGYHFIQLQGICVYKTRFIHCLVGHAGSVHDQRVFRLSDVQEYL